MMHSVQRSLLSKATLMPISMSESRFLRKRSDPESEISKVKP